MRRFSTVIIGGGVAGLSTAYHLAKVGSKNILVLEAERQLGGHASGRNAGMIRQAVKDPVIARLAVQGVEALRRAATSGWKGLEYRQNGSMLLSSQKNCPELIHTHNTLKNLKVTCRYLSPAQAQKKVSILKGHVCSQALFCPRDGSVDVYALLFGFLERLKQMGVRVSFGTMPSHIQKTIGGFSMTVSGRIVHAERLVNAAGAWCSVIASQCGAVNVPLKAYRRHLFYTPKRSWVNPKWPFVWDVDADFYFRPMDGGLLMSPCDKREISPKSKRSRDELVDPRAERFLEKKKKSFSSFFSVLNVTRVQSGLRTMTPDGRFVIGQDSKVGRFYWVAGLGGHGVTTCFSVGKLASDIILNNRPDAEFVSAYSPDRF